MNKSSKFINDKFMVSMYKKKNSKLEALRPAETLPSGLKKAFIDS